MFSYSLWKLKKIKRKKWKEGDRKGRKKNREGLGERNDQLTVEQEFGNKREAHERQGVG